jgi:hypothetical protein
MTAISMVGSSAGGIEGDTSACKSVCKGADEESVVRTAKEDWTGKGPRTPSLATGRGVSGKMWLFMAPFMVKVCESFRGHAGSALPDSVSIPCFPQNGAF